MAQATSLSRTNFDYQKFLSTSTEDLVAYMEPILNDPNAVVSSKDLQRMAADFPSFDEYHCVYAIELCTDLMPSLFALPVAGCLKHPCQSVRLAAHRALTRLPVQAISANVIDACREAIASGAPLVEMGNLPDYLGRRFQSNSRG